MVFRRYRFRLYPNKTQERELLAAPRLHAYLYNACTAHRRFEWKKHQKTVDYFEQQNCLPAFKKEWVEFQGLHSQALQSTVKRVDLAYNSYPRFTRSTDAKIKQESTQLRRKRAPHKKKGIKASNRWKKALKKVSKLQSTVANQRRDWQHKVTSDIASRYDIGVTEKLNTKSMTRKAKKGSKRKQQKAGLNKSILSVGFGTLNQMIGYKIEAKGGLLLQLNTSKIKPSQRCPNCGTVHQDWANLSNRYHICNTCNFEIERDRGSVLIMYNVATNQQQGLGISLSDSGCLSSTSLTGKRKHTGSMKQLGQLKRQKSRLINEELETPTSSVS